VPGSEKAPFLFRVSRGGEEKTSPDFFVLFFFLVAPSFRSWRCSFPQSSLFLTPSSGFDSSPPPCLFEHFSSPFLFFDGKLVAYCNAVYPLPRRGPSNPGLPWFLLHNVAPFSLYQTRLCTWPCLYCPSCCCRLFPCPEQGKFPLFGPYSFFARLFSWSW